MPVDESKGRSGGDDVAGEADANHILTAFGSMWMARYVEPFRLEVS
jgi:hypothetical protein